MNDLFKKKTNFVKNFQLIIQKYNYVSVKFVFSEKKLFFIIKQSVADGDHLWFPICSKNPIPTDKKWLTIDLHGPLH